MLNLLNQAVENFGGIEKAMQACDRMYSAKFRTEAYSIKELGDDWEYELSTLVDQFAFDLYVKTNNIILPKKPSYDSDDYQFDNYYSELEYIQDDAVHWFNSNYDRSIFDENTLIVTLCNYKGEGEKEALLIGAKDLPVFISKVESFNQANY